MGIEAIAMGDKNMQTPVFCQHDSGLYVPEAISRRRQVWTRSEWKLYERALKLFTCHGLAVQFKCNTESCDDRVIVRAGTRSEPILRCGCTDRVFTSAF